MHVVFESSCTKSALKRTRRVLDSYATRIGESSWATPITEAGLNEVRSLLRRTATKNTQVACFRNDGMRRMRLLWSVGRHRGYNNAIGKTKSRRTPSNAPIWVSAVAIVAELSGLLHDLGKYNTYFQDKLRTRANEIVADPIRHEWFSLFIAKKLLDGAPWEDAIKLNYKDINPAGKAAGLWSESPESGIAAVLWCVATHHKLPGGYRHVRKGSSQDHIRFVDSRPADATFRRIIKLKDKLDRIDAGGNCSLFWRGVANIARIALVMADHQVSSLDAPAKALAYANTKDGRPNQCLDWHLNHVANMAGAIPYRMATWVPDCLSVQSMDAITAIAPKHYDWQNHAARALQATERRPTLVMNMAGTGTGKTHMNIRSLAVMRDDARIVCALNLRTLTLQSGAAYKRMGIPDAEITTIIGDAVTQKLFETSRADIDAESDVEPDIESTGYEPSELPDWIRFYTDKSSHTAAILSAPLCVSTIDFLIAAGEPNRQAHHALACLRLMHSDLILDEIDGYDPVALLSVLRLVTTAAMFGRNIVASSATLSQPVAKMLYQSFVLGVGMYSALNGNQIDGQVAFIDDCVSPEVMPCESVEIFEIAYKARATKIIASQDGARLRIPAYSGPINSTDDWLREVRIGCRQLSDWHGVKAKIGERRISIGLVRVANIPHAVKTARHLADDGFHVCCYHAGLTTIQRYHIEATLDRLLTRHAGSDHWFNDPEIASLPGNDLRIIVVATPVEEIGRDHDFDWGVIEPSSIQSIVQAAGRINRHRKIAQNLPNVIILRKSWRGVAKPDGNAFKWPGFDIDSAKPYPKDITDLLGVVPPKQISAELRLNVDRYEFARRDNESIENQCSNVFGKYMASGWQEFALYQASPLRDNKLSAEFEMIELTPGGNMKFNLRIHDNGFDDTRREPTIAVATKHMNAWLSLSLAEQENMSELMGISRNDGLRASALIYNESQSGDMLAIERAFRFDESFGLYKTPKEYHKAHEG